MSYMMKTTNFIKTISLVLVLTLVFTLVAGCTPTAPTYSYTRWENETLVYNISLANYETVKETIGDTTTEYTQDYNIYADLPNYDKIVPTDVNGEKVVTISKLAGETVTYKMTTTIEAVEIYDKSVDNGQFDLVKTFETTSSVGLKTVITNETVFDEGFNPISSSRDVLSCYVGNQHKEQYSYTLEVEYENKVATISFVDRIANETKTATFDGSIYSFLLDSDQLLLYARSLDQSDSAFQGTVSVATFDALACVLNPNANPVVNITFNLARSVKRAVFNNAEDIWYFVKVNEMSLFHTNFGYYIYNTCNDVDGIQLGTTGTRCKYSTVKVQEGYWVYELDFTNQDQNTQTIWDSLVYIPVTE